MQRDKDSQLISRPDVANVWKLNRTPKTLVSDHRTMFRFQIPRKFEKHRGIRLNFSTSYHPRTNGELAIANMTVEQHVPHFSQDHQEKWDMLLTLTQLMYNNNDHISIGVVLFKKKCVYGPMYRRIPSTKQCTLTVEAWLKTI